jgi:5-oxoprolinase (ATP-hydrolysing)
LAQPDLKPRWQFWIDRGGTFTDVVAKRPDGSLVTHKLLSACPERYADAALQGIRDLLDLASEEPIPVEVIESVKMGTTVATNALLERAGERTALVITQGYADALRIGYQNRPRLFDRQIVLPEPLAEQVIEITERVSARGEVLTPLDLEAARASLRTAHDAGIRSVAIVLMHGYRFPAHERSLAALATEIGFSQVSVSHQVSPLMKLVGRGDTTVVDAYLSPILRRYVETVAASLGGVRLLFMQSSGGLTDASLFCGKDSILSGPAGGLVGAVKTSAMAGFDKVIGFDMGGTSTDVTHFDGEYERATETLVAGVRMRAPMLRIHTVAAGGGSILAFDGGRYRVGPASAGADPGPACYRRGGPLTITDCNVMLGKLQPSSFPRVFGPAATEPLDAEIVERRFSELTRRVRDETGDTRTPVEVAEGFLEIAVENMANAIKKISIQRGYDVTEYTLCCFGGAGGQHACRVADALGMTRIFIHPYAGVLSAYGMGLADIRVIREAAVEEFLDATLLPRLQTTLATLAAEAGRELARQGVPPERTEILPRAHVKYDGTDTALAVALGDEAELRARFEEAHQRSYGFVVPDRALVVESLSVELIGTTESVDDPLLVSESSGETVAAGDRARVHTCGRFQMTPVYDRMRLRAGNSLDGPAVIIEANATTVVEPGWRAEVTSRNHLVMTRVHPVERRHPVGCDADPVMLEVFNNLFMSIAEQMGSVLEKTSYSVNIKERLDFSCAVFDVFGGLIANAPHMPVHLGSMSESVRAIIDRHAGSMKPGDVYALNAPYNGGTHLPDVTVVTPVFDDAGREILFYVGARGHHADIGGLTPGSMPPDSTTVEEEGVLIDNFLLVDGGRFREPELRELLASGRWPARNPDQNVADLKAQIAACEKGVQELRRIVEHFGLDVVQAQMQHVQDNAEEQVRRVLDVLTDGSFVYPLDNGAEIAVSIRIDSESRSAQVDFTGTSAQQEDNFNAPRAVTRAAVLYVFRTLVDDEIPMNEGVLKPLELILPERSLLSPEYPAAVVAGNVETSQCVTDALYGALGVLAAAQGTMNNFTFGDETYQYYETICGGSGAGPGFDGTSAVHTHMTNSRLTDPEVLEWRFPVVLETFHIRRGSGGGGRYRGGDGVVRRVRFTRPMTAAILSNHRRIAPFGLAGGEPGSRGRNWVERCGRRIDLSATDRIDLRSGDVFVIETPGGGGWGRTD